MGTNTGIGIGIGIPFRNNALGGDSMYFPPELKARMIGVWDNYGKKNTDADRNIIKNKIPNAGGDLEILNAAYEGMSGCNGYPVVFGANETWETLSSVYSYTSDVTSTTIHITRVKNADTGLLFSYVKKDGALTNIREIPAFRVTVKGLEGNSKFGYRYLATEDATVETLVYLGNGTHELSKSFTPTEALLDLTRNAWVGMFITPMVEGEVVFDCDITIEVLPEYEGAFVTDGVNDMIISQKTIAEMGITDEVTIVSMIHQIILNSTYGNGFTNYIENLDKSTYVRNNIYKAGKTGIYGYSVSLINRTGSNINNILGDKNDYGFEVVNRQNILNASKLSIIGRATGFNEISSIAHYWTFAVLGKATADEINLIIAKYNLDRTLRPDILCNITKQGITNDNHADFNDKLVDYSGNGRDIQMYNLAWKGGSGVAAKKFETIKDYLIVPDEGLQELTIYNEFSYKVKSIKHADRYWTVQSLNKTDVSYPITIIADKDIIWRNILNYTDENGVKGNIRKETNVPANIPTQVFILGFNDFDVPDNYTKVNCVSYATRADITEFTVTFIPSYKGGLLLDGVNDFGQFVGDLGLKDYTLIMNRAYNNLINNQVPLVSSNIVEDQTPFIVEHWNTGSNAISFSYGASRTTDIPLDINKKIVYQSTYSYMGYVIPKGNAISTGGGITLGKFGNGVQYSAICLWSLMLFPYSMSEFLIERQLKKHKLGTLYPDMVEFRPIIKANNDYEIVYTAIIKPDNWQEISVGDYVTVGESVAIQIKLNNPLEVTNVSSNSLADISFYKEENSDNIYTIYGRVLDGKSPQKITIDIQVDSSLVQWNPVVESTAEYSGIGYLNYSHNLATINVGDYISIGDIVAIRVILDNTVDEIVNCKVNGQECEIVNVSPRVFDCKFTLTSESPQNINITIDEYIRYEDIVQPYPVLLRFNDENGNEVSWGGKFKVGSTITRIGSAADSNLLPNIYNIFGLLLNDNQVTSSKVIVEKTMVFKAKNAYIFDNNEPKCILSPRLLRIPNSSYKILGYIPDISGHGNHGVIHNSAYAEGSGVNEDGSYQLDGVDDFVTIPTLSSGGKQVLMKVNWQSSIAQAMLYDQRGTAFAIWNSDKFNDDEVDTTPAYSARNGGNTYIDGILNKNILASQLRNITHNIVATNNMVNGNSVSPSIGCTLSNSYYSQMALYDFMLFDNISTDDKIKDLNEYVGIEAKVELPPYYWDAYGKTNLDADKATIQQRGVAVGDYDLTNTNFAYDKMSGFGGYSLGRFDKSWASSSSNNTSVVVVLRNPYDITLKKLGGNSDWEFNTTELKIISNPVSVKFKSNKNIRFTCDYHYYPVGENSEGTPLGITSKDLIANEDTVITISPISQENIDKYNIDVNRGYYLIYFQLSSTLAVDEEVTIEMLPLYTNGLVYDGITDYSENANIPAFTDFTYVFKRKLLDNVADASSITKGLTDQQRAFVVDYINTTGDINATSFGNMAFVPSLRDSDIIYCTTNSVNGTNITKGSNPDSNGIDIGKFVTQCKKIVFYKLILYPKTIPLLQINFLKNLMEKDELIDLNNPIFKK